MTWSSHILLPLTVTHLPARELGDVASCWMAKGQANTSCKGRKGEEKKEGQVTIFAKIVIFVLLKLLLQQRMEYYGHGIDLTGPQWEK